MSAVAIYGGWAIVLHDSMFWNLNGVCCPLTPYTAYYDTYATQLFNKYFSISVVSKPLCIIQILCAIMIGTEMNKISDSNMSALFNISSDKEQMLNISSVEEQLYIKKSPVFYIFRVSEALIGLLGNSLFLITVARMKKIPNNMYIVMCSLSMTDTIAGMYILLLLPLLMMLHLLLMMMLHLLLFTHPLSWLIRSWPLGASWPHLVPIFASDEFFASFEDGFILPGRVYRSSYFFLEQNLPNHFVLSHQKLPKIPDFFLNCSQNVSKFAASFPLLYSFLTFGQHFCERSQMTVKEENKLQILKNFASNFNGSKLGVRSQFHNF